MARVVALNGEAHSALVPGPVRFGVQLCEPLLEVVHVRGEQPGALGSILRLVLRLVRVPLSARVHHEVDPKTLILFGCLLRGGDHGVELLGAAQHLGDGLLLGIARVRAHERRRVPQLLVSLPLPLH